MACYCDDEFDCVLLPPEVVALASGHAAVWNVDVCPNSVESPSNRVPNAKAPSIQRDHRGLMACKCGHNLGQGVFSLDQKTHAR